MAKKPTVKSAKKATKKVTTKKPVAKKPVAKKTLAKKTAVKKAAPKKTAAKKTTVKKTAAKKVVAKKPAVKSAAKKAAPKKVTAKKAPAKKVAAKKATAKKPTKKAATKKAASTIKTNPARVPLADPGPAEVLGRITWLMLQSEPHKHLFLTDLEWRVLPPVLLKQFRLFRKDGAPIGYAAWALVDDDTDTRLRKGETKLKPEDWRSGPNLWLLDLIAPFGGEKVMLKELGEKVFKGKSFRTFMPGKDDKGLRVVEIGKKV
jgi:cytolysin-activating lysine-acyltransferase